MAIYINSTKLGGNGLNLNSGINKAYANGVLVWGKGSGVKPLTSPPYGFKISKTETDPDKAVTYIENAVGLTPAHMDYGNDKFDYGSWKDAFFIPKPCIIDMVTSNADRNVVYLNPDDYSKTLSGEDSGYDTYYDGRAVAVEFPQIWFKTNQDSDYMYCYIADKQLDEDYYCYTHTNSDGKYDNYIYLAAYESGAPRISTPSPSTSPLRYESKANAYPINNVSISGVYDVLQGSTGTPDGSYTQNGGSMGTLADRQMVNLLLILIGKSLNTQKVFGTGYSSPMFGETYYGVTGDTYNKGLFWGSDDYYQHVKVFGIEDWWGNHWKLTLGFVSHGGKLYVQMTPPYYVTSKDITGNYSKLAFEFSGSNDYITSMRMNNKGLFPKASDGTGGPDIGCCDYLEFNKGGVSDKFAMLGGARLGDQCGAFTTSLRRINTYSSYDVGFYMRWSQYGYISSGGSTPVVPPVTPPDPMPDM